MHDVADRARALAETGPDAVRGLVDRVEPVVPAPGHGSGGVSKPDASRSNV